MVPEPPPPPPDLPGEVTLSLQRWREGDPAQGERLMEIVYQELRRLAAHYLRNERSDHTLQPTALVHEAWLKLGDPERHDWRDRHHFFASAARGMRRYLVDHARAHRREKRGGGWQRVELDPALEVGAESTVDFLALDDALGRLREKSEDLARLVELRFFAGLPMEGVAEVLGVSERTARRDWAFARAWLQEEMARAEGS